jgi:hypothetical protein
MMANKKLIPFWILDFGLRIGFWSLGLANPSVEFFFQIGIKMGFIANPVFILPIQPSPPSPLPQERGRG